MRKELLLSDPLTGEFVLVLISSINFENAVSFVPSFKTLICGFLTNLIFRTVLGLNSSVFLFVVVSQRNPLFLWFLLNLEFTLLEYTPDETSLRNFSWSLSISSNKLSFLHVLTGLINRLTSAFFFGLNLNCSNKIIKIDKIEYKSKALAYLCSFLESSIILFWDLFRLSWVFIYSVQTVLTLVIEFDILELEVILFLKFILGRLLLFLLNSIFYFNINNL